jgi:plasmid stability protein
MPSNVFSTMAARAKAHHDSLNAAYRATYSPGSSTSTPNTSRTSSTASAMPAQPSDRNITKAWKAIKKHHKEMNEAYAVFYAPGSVSSTPASSRVNSAAPSPKVSLEGQREQELAPRNYEKVWKAIKTRAVEHHKSVESASAARYF